MSDYLWNRTNPVDDDIQRWEHTLSSLRSNRRYHLPADARRDPRHPPYAAVAAAALLAVLGPLLQRGTPNEPSRWTSEGRILRQGQSLDTRQQPILLEAEDFGQVRVGENTRIRLGRSHNLELKQGRLHALIWAPPGQFVVETPSARTIDLGCQYELEIDAEGAGLLTVETGWVAFEHGARESFIPAGAACRTHPTSGPGVPYYQDAPASFRQAVQSNDIPAILAGARPRDALTLWHLLARVSPSERGAVFDRFRTLVPVNAGRQAVVALEPVALDQCWNALNLDSAEWWRKWKRPWR